MGIFDIFTGDPAKDAAAQNAALYQQYGAQSQGLLGQYGTQAGQLYTNLGNVGQGYLTDYGTQAQQALQGGTAPAEAAYASARGAYAPLTALGTKYGAATTQYLDALGANGPEAQARYFANVNLSPGVQFGIDQATKAAAAKAASLGVAGTGNTMDAIAELARGRSLGDVYNTQLAGLSGFVNPELQATTGAAGGIANTYNQQAGLYPALAQNQANLLTNLGAARTGLAGAVTSGQAGVLGNVAQGNVNVLGNVTGGQAAANQQAAQAAMQGSQAFWNGLFNLGGAAAKAAFA